MKKKKKRKAHKITLVQVGELLLYWINNMVKIQSELKELNKNTTKLWAELYEDVKIMKGIMHEKEKSELLDTTTESTPPGMEPK